MKKFLLTICLMTTVLTLMPTSSLAKAADEKKSVQISDELKPPFAATLPTEGSNSGNVILQLIAGSLIYAAGPVAVLMIAIGGFRYVTSHGETTQMEAAKKTILWAIIGLLVIIVSYAIVRNIIDIAASTTPPT